MIRRYFLSTVAAILFAVGGFPLAKTAAGAEFSDVAIFATNSIALKSNVTVTGNVVVNEVSPGPTIGPPTGFELSVDRKSSVTGDLTANRIKVFGQAVINGDVDYGTDLINQGTINGLETAGYVFPVFDVLPPFQSASLSGGEQDVFVASGQTVVLSANEYGDITIDDDGILSFTGGIYNIRSIDAVGDDATILFDAPTQLRIAGKFRTRKNAVIGPANSSIDASNIVFFVAGINGSDGDLNSTPAAARVGSGSVVDANFYAPNGTFRAETNVVATGAFLGRDVRIDSRAAVNLNSYFFPDAPQARDDGPFSLAEGGSVSGNVLTNDFEPDGDPLTITSFGSPPVYGSPASFGAVSLAANGDFTYTHDGSETTGDSFTYEICDNEVPPQCAQADVTFTITPVNDAPVALPEAVITDGTTPLVITLTGTDAEGDSLIFSLVPPVPTEGTLSGLTQVPPSNATVTYTPSAAGDLPDSFGFRVTDPGLAFGDAVVDINAPDPSPDPVFGGEVVARDVPGGFEAALEVTLNQVVDITLVAYADVEDPDCTAVPADPLCIPVGDFAFTITQNPSGGGSLSPLTSSMPPIRSATVTYTAPNFEGSDTFKFQACVDLSEPRNGDTTDLGECDEGTVTIAIAEFVDPPDPVPPVAKDQVVTTQTNNSQMEIFVEIDLFAQEESGDCTAETPENCDPDDRPVGAKSFRAPEVDPVAAGGPFGNTLWDLSVGQKTGNVGGFGHSIPTLDECQWSLFYCATAEADCEFNQPNDPVVSSFTFTAPTGGAAISVTDVLQKGDTFTVYDYGQSIGTTSTVTPVSGTESNPDTAYADSSYSSGTFLVSAGMHLITIQSDLANLDGVPAHAFARVDTSGSPFCPDLVVSSLTHVPASPDSETTIDFAAEVKNIGPVAAGESALCFEIGGESCTSSPGTVFNVPTLAPGGTFEVQRAEQLPVTVTTNFTNTAVADYDQDVAESDEANNTTIDSYTVTPVTELRVVATITLPAGFTGTLLDSNGTPLAVGQTTQLTNTTVTYVPPAGVTGSTSFQYMLTDQNTGFSSVLAQVDVNIFGLIDLCVIVGREPGCAPGPG